MSGPADRFEQDTDSVSDVRRAELGKFLHEYTGVLADTDERVRLLTLAPEFTHINAAVDAFSQVSDTWHNASANANILTVLDRGTEPRPWIAVPDDNSDTLATLQPELSPGAIETVIRETTDALRTLGLYNTVHGHLSPDDIYLQNGAEETGELLVEVGGFGLEAAIQAVVGEFEPTAYTAPELLDNPDQPTKQTDVYSVGAITYFALTGSPPVEGADLDQAIRDGPSGAPSVYDGAVPSELNDVVMQALSTSPDERYESSYAFGRAFLSTFDPDDMGPEDSGEDSGEEAETVGSTDPDDDSEDDSADSTETAETIVSRRATVGLLGVGILGGGGWYLSQGGTPTNEQATNEQATSEQATTESATPVQSPTATLTRTPAQTSVQKDTPTQTPTQTPAQEASFAPDDGNSRDHFGWSVSLSSDGSTALIGARFDEDPNGYDAGSAYVFDSSGSSWTQQAKLAADDGNIYDNFGVSVTLSSDGTTALIGACWDEDPNGNTAGSAYVFDSSDGSWTQQAKLAADDSESPDSFGWSVSLSGDGSTALIGAPVDEDSNGNTAGPAYVFGRSGGWWSQQVKLTPDDGDSDDSFGGSVTLSSDGSTALIGASGDEDPNGDNAGSAYVFGSSGGLRTQQAKLAPDDGDSDDAFGFSVALSSDGSTALIGAPGDEAGSAYVFDSSGGSWTQQAKLAPDDGDSDDSFGFSVALSSDGSTALIGASGDEDPNNELAGSAYVFDSSGGSWTQQAKLAPDDGDSDDAFGVSVTLSSDGSSALIGAPVDEDPNGDEAGSAYVFE
ncbi:hypothetical protein [Haloarcula laminariae]|uniref:hypothetical protein n=1 Tax=Haloarcula laminariae TaxID=2961577 RepID=UPI002405E15A|nr:hypothetical protein [Halomicroarcula sp. FL173]